MAYDLIIFDCDGTLVDSEELNNHAASQVITAAGISGYTPEIVAHRFIGHTISSVFDMVGEESGQPMPEDSVERFMQAVQDGAAEYISENPETVDIITNTSRTHKICVASNGERRNVLTGLEMTGLSALFPEDIVFTRAMVEKGKPAPDLFLMVADTFGVAPERCFVVEDSVAGVTAGKAAGMSVAGFTGYAEDVDACAKDLQDAGADVVVHQFSDLPKHWS